MVEIEIWGKLKKILRFLLARPTLQDSPLKVKEEACDHEPPSAAAAAGDGPASETSAPCGTVDPEDIPATQPDEEPDVLDKEAFWLWF
jgi:hypothetical protein